MKRTISVILVALLIIFTAMLLVACTGGINKEEDWNSAMQAFLTADAVTLKIKDDMWTYKSNSIIIDHHDKSNITLSFDGKKGIVAITYKYNDYTIRGGWANGTYKMYYVKEDNKIIFYKMFEGSSAGWNYRQTKTFDTEDEAMAFLRKLYINPTNQVSMPFTAESPWPDFTEMNYNNFTAGNMGKFEYVKTDNDRRVNTFTLNFSNGKPTKFTYDTRMPKEVVNTDKYSVKIYYSASITLPDGLPTQDIG